MTTLEKQLNQALQSQIPPKVRKGTHRIAIDLNLLPYYGKASEAEDPYIYRFQAKSGTTSFFAYATLYVISHNQRVTLGIHAVSRRETLVATATYLCKSPMIGKKRHTNPLEGKKLIKKLKIRIA
ncbi:hypothetical protein TUMEXPCC7403_12750 [Tumidithrix helvetica PCC 7403]|uniref:hypothetical protein n=1 Tax=Tumidithrix helvetica TaxID=3457545 RepID=UPI003C810A22